MTKSVCLYFLVNAHHRTYLGVTNNIHRRLRTHNSSAPSLRRHYTNRHNQQKWKLLAKWSGFRNRAQCLRAEYACKHRLRQSKLARMVLRHSERKVANIIHTLTSMIQDGAKLHASTRLRCELHLTVHPNTSKLLNRLQSHACQISQVSNSVYQ